MYPIIETVRRIALLSLLALAATAASASASQDLYVGGSSGTGPRIAGFDLAADGSLGPLTGAPVAGGSSAPQGIAIAPDGATLYAAGSGGGLPGFLIGEDGALGFGGTTDEARPFFDVAVTPDGRFAYGSDGGAGGGIRAYSREPGGALTPLAAPSAYAGAAGLAISPDGRFLFATSIDSSGVRPFAIGADGALSPAAAEVPGGSSPVALALSPDGRFLYVAGAETNSSIRTYAIATDGSLSSVGSPQITAGDETLALLVAPDGRHLYVADHGSSSLGEFAIGADGRPTMGIPPIPLAGAPVALAANVTGTRLYVADGDAERTFAFSLGANGFPTVLAGSPFSTGVEANIGSLALSPDQPPVARFTTAVNNQRVSFDAFGSSDADGEVARYDWDFGGGLIVDNGGPQLTQRYPKGRKPPVTLTVTDDAGCSTAFVSDGNTPYCNGSAVARTTITPFQLDLVGKHSRSQKLRRNIRLKLRSRVDAKVHVIGRLKLSGKGVKVKKAKVKGARAKLKAGRAKTLKLRLSKRGVRDADAARKAVARLKIVAKDGLGDQFKLKPGLRLR